MTDRDKERSRTGEGTISLECMTMQTILALASLNEIGRLKECVPAQALHELSQSVEPHRLAIEALGSHHTPYTPNRGCRGRLRYDAGPSRVSQRV
jgi:hypothetical protein